MGLARCVKCGTLCVTDEACPTCGGRDQQAVEPDDDKTRRQKRRTGKGKGAPMRALVVLAVLLGLGCAEQPCKRWGDQMQNVCTETRREPSGMTCINMGEWTGMPIISCDQDYRTVCVRWEKQPRRVCLER